MKRVLQVQIDKRTSSNSAPLGVTRPRIRTKTNVDSSWVVRRKAQ